LSPNGETTRVPLLGLLMVILARAGAADTSSARRNKPQIFIEGNDQPFLPARSRRARSHLLESTHGLQPARAATSSGCNQQVSYSSDSLSIQSLLLSPDGWSIKLRNELRAVNYKKVTAW
jgi:hypothetical protein